MVALLERTMPKRSTKPRKEEGPKSSRQIRVKEDLGLMIAWLVRIKGESSPELVDPYLRAAITTRLPERIVGAISSFQ